MTVIVTAFVLPTSNAASAALRLPSSLPPAGLEATQVPQFVMIGFDDNPDLDPMTWILDYMAPKRNPAGQGHAATYDGVPARAAFYSNGKYLDPSLKMRQIHLRAFEEGHELGNHTYNHHHGGKFSAEEWLEEMRQNRRALLKAEIPAEAQIGFRTPYLGYNAATFTAIAEFGFVYDSSIEEGGQPDQDGTNFLWPYTLDQGSPGNAYSFSAQGARVERVASHPSVWEIPLHQFMVPPDERCLQYDVPIGLRQRIYENVKTHAGWDWNREAGKITGLDWNVLELAHLNGPDFLAILKYTLNLRLAGNRAPLMVGGHTQLYPASKPDRREAMEAFIDYALSKPEVRLVTPQQVLAWLRSPVSLAE
jgi:peptidoglycan/xylan/chitin deacetylase (PgdA/CDA1 family)